MYYPISANPGPQCEKMRTILRGAALNGHVNLAIGGFGADGTGLGGPGWNKNPVAEVTFMRKRRVLFEDEKFKGYFVRVVFRNQQ